MSQPTAYKIRHSHGTTERHDTWAEVWAALVSVYGSEVYVADPHGSDLSAKSSPDLAESRALAWQTEDLSQDDDGALAVASISAVY